MDGTPSSRLFCRRCRGRQPVSPPLLARFHDDVIQECHLLAWEAQVRHYVTVKNGPKPNAMATAGGWGSNRLPDPVTHGSMCSVNNISAIRRLYGRTRQQ